MSLFGDVASFIGGGIQAGASYLGAREARKAADKNRDFSYDIYKQQRADTAPYRQTANLALSNLRDTYITGDKDFRTSPGYDFRVGEGVKALDRSAAARGRLNSGGQAKALTRFGQDIGSAEYDRGFNRMTSLAGLGSGAVAQDNTAANNLMVNVGGANTDAAAARRSGYEGVGSAFNTTLNNLLASSEIPGGPSYSLRKWFS
ncbi:hypothetical protein HBA54_04835 [Pelagibius litoralis]|uniref:Uncharacterized protein n=1 Tax=Pelagibius litoralis TaxID=374515 RepID=A0A967EUY7_9PROT|nr:hypothetical protein [Pelagibius litoralis]NIA67911.1 hypothetical protein [Pelagibius litoralis]